MRTHQEHTATQRLILTLPHLFRLLLLVLAGIALPAIAHGQTDFWLHRAIAERGLTSSNTQVALDAWGNTHAVWGSNDQDRSGVQLFYSSDATGTFSQPLQFTDASNGVVFDSAAISTSPFQFRLDNNGAVHAAFIANRLNHLYLFYTTNRNPSTGKPGRFPAADSLAEVTRYGLAVDSAGVAHIVWVEEFPARYDIRYHSSLDPPAVNTLIASVPCACRVGDPSVSVGSNGVEVVFRADSGSLYYLRKPPTGSFGAITLLPTPQYDRTRFASGTGDLRVASAVDASGTLHILQPHFDATAGHRLLYLDNASGSFNSFFLTRKSDTSARTFALASDHQREQLGAVWTQHPSLTAGGSTAVQMLARTSPSAWSAVGTPTNLNAVSVGSYPFRFSTSSIFLRDGRMVVGGLHGSDSIRWNPAFYDRASIAPTISYLLPDAAAPGMNVVVETYAPYRQQGSFGQDGFQPGTAELQLLNPQDSSRVIVGPTVISWNGRLASTMLFLKAGAAVGAVPVRMRVGAAFSNVDTFFVVKPQQLGGPSGQLSGGGVLGSGGMFGAARSRRGVLVVDSLILLGGAFTVDTSDTDPATPGNQGFLPVTILSRGRVSIAASATLSVSAPNPVSGVPSGVAGPGGGGGGSGGQIGGGSGYTGGGGAGAYLLTNGDGESPGSGGNRSGFWSGGSSLNGTPGGATYPNATSGGGTGHPFGASAWYGRISRKETVEKNIGGYGGGAGGALPLSTGDLSWGGGGGAFGTPGGDGDNFGKDSSGGYVVGSSPLVPIAGGSGGGAAFAPPTNTANGGGGGGALLLVSFGSLNLAGRIAANGADGVGNQGLLGASGGGGGAGGAILLAAKRDISLPGLAPLSARGGQGGIGATGGNNGGNGGEGRIRIDGRTAQNPGITPTPAYRGPALIGSGGVQSLPGQKVTGSGMPGATIHLFSRSESTPWNYSGPLVATVGSDSLWSVTLGNDLNPGPLFLVAMQRVANASREEFRMEPEWVMSPAAGGIAGRAAVAPLPDTVDVGCIRFDSCGTYSIPIKNIGDYSDLLIRDAWITGDTVFTVAGRDGVILAGATGSIRVRFCPDSSKAFSATLTILTNATPDTLRTIVLRGCGLSGILTSTEATMQLGQRCPGVCVDTTITFRNVGNAALEMEQIVGDSIRMTVEVLSGISFPKRLEPGDSVTVRLRLCLRRIDVNGSRIYALSNAIEPIYSELIVYAINAGPAPIVPDVVDFGNVTLPATDPCITRSFTVKNQSAISPLRVVIGQVSSPAFTLISPATRDTTIPPEGSVELIGKFCSNQVGTFRDTLRFSFSSGGCTLDTAVEWIGTASFVRPQPNVIRPLIGDTLRFPASIIGIDRYVDSVIILNTGNATARIRPPALIRDAGTGVAELEIDNVTQPIFPYDLEPNQSVAIRLNFAPTAAGEKKAFLLLQDSNGWSDTVVVVGRGIASSIRLTPALLDFGDVRVGSVSDENMAEVTNMGDAVEEVKRVVRSGDTSAIVRAAIAPVPPVELLPAQGNSLKLSYRFAPVAEREYEAFDTVVFAARTSLRLRGRGVLEHAAADRDTVDFGCQFAGSPVDSANAIVIRNTGTYPLTVDSLAVVEGGEWFQIVGGSAATIPPQGTAAFALRYSPHTGQASGKVRLFSSAAEVVEVQLLGDLCADTRQLSIAVAETSGAIGETANITISVELSQPLDRSLPVSMTLAYSDDIITPLWDSGPIQQGTIPGVAVSSGGEGVMKISGEIPAMTATGTLLKMPVRVLLGATWFSPLRLTNVAVKAAGIGLHTTNARLLVLDCDTTGGIIFQGNYALSQNTPNPFNPTTTIRYEIARQDRVRLTLYGPMGNQVATLLDEVQQKGTYEYHLNAKGLPSGVYTYQLQSGPFRKTRRMVVME
ncbi:MAG: choice-of-anchor D domain-containing protein [Candidatus Kapabacteria bacterium]|nr:choice-of-anchor D domain-containing protein [Candidatus Kapabacteria bacterium]